MTYIFVDTGMLGFYQEGHELESGTSACLTQHEHDL